MATRVLLIDDDPKIVSLLQRGLAFEGFDVTTAPDGNVGLSAASAQPPQLVLLDIAMPELDGFEVCRRLRAAHDVPVIMLTARDDVSDKVTALNLGADDYVAKPFAFDELLARIRAVLRRHQSGDEPLTYGDLVVDPRTRETRRSGRVLELTGREFELLYFLVRHPRQVLTRQQLTERVWGYDESPETNALDVHIAHLRQKLEAMGSRA
jgi:two-component system response regulator MprA